MNLDNNKIKDNLYDLYAAYRQHKALYDFWKSFRGMKSVDEIKERIEYIKKNKINQRNEIETLMWVINLDEKETKH